MIFIVLLSCCGVRKWGGGKEGGKSRVSLPSPNKADK